MANFLDDVVFPAAGVLKRLATGTPDASASQQANARAAANPSGIDMQAEAAKAAARAKAAAPQTAPSTPATTTGTRDHYTPRGSGQ